MKAVGAPVMIIFLDFRVLLTNELSAGEEITV